MHAHTQALVHIMYCTSNSEATVCMGMYVCTYVHVQKVTVVHGGSYYIRMYMLDFGLGQGSPREYEVMCEGG